MESSRNDPRKSLDQYTSSVSPYRRSLAPSSSRGKDPLAPNGSVELTLATGHMTSAQALVLGLVSAQLDEHVSSIGILEHHDLGAPVTVVPVLHDFDRRLGLPALLIGADGNLGR